MRVLLLNNTFQPLAFVSDRKAIRLILKDKVEILGVWSGNKYYYGNGFIELPAVIRMKYQVKRNFNRIIFSRNLVFKRDKFVCQYCSSTLTHANITVDHILPKSRGGKNSFENCVTSCINCNLSKGVRTPDEAGMKLIRQPKAPDSYVIPSVPEGEWHQLWGLFVNL